MTTNAQSLYLIDGHAQMFRAFFAIRTPMTSPVTGEPTNATFAFTGMLLKLFREFRPRFVAMAIDSPGKNFRHELYPDYKGTRRETPETFGPQVPRMIEIAKLFGIPVLAEPRVEADDLIATVIRRTLDDSEHRDVQVRIVSRDKDLLQLLGERVVMMDIHKDEIIDPRKLHEERGITPQQVVDMLILMGDNVDNIPGVNKVGEKTAAELLKQFGSLDNLLTHLDQIKGKRRQFIEEAAPLFDLTRKLVTLDDQVAIDFDMNAAKVGMIEGRKLMELFEQLGFNRHRADLEKLLEGGPPEWRKAEGGTTQSAAPVVQGSLFAATAPEQSYEAPRLAASAGTYRCIKTQKQLDDAINAIRAANLLSVDTETIGLGHRTQLCGICLAWKEGQGVYIPLRSPTPDAHLSPKKVLDTLKDVLEDESVSKCGHNIKYDLLVLREAGVELRGIVFDSMIGAFLAGAPGTGLDALAQSQLGHRMMPITDLIGHRPSRKNDPPQKTMDQIELDLITDYAAEDADFTLRLTNIFRGQLNSLGMKDLAERVEMPLVEVLARMESNGIAIDPGVLDEQRETLQQRIDELRDAIHEAAGEPINPDSPKQLSELLFDKLKLPRLKRTKTGASTDVEVLERLVEMDDIPRQKLRVPQLVLEYRQLAKLVGTYLVNLKEAIHPDTGRIHCSFHQTGAATGRLSSSNPNLQNIPIRTEIGRQIRRAFVAPGSCELISADYSQIELRMLAHLAEDDALIEAFRQKQDIHTAVAVQVFGVPPEEITIEQRTHAKTINFGIIYGVTPYGLARRIDNLDVDSARKLIDDYKARFPGIDRFLYDCVQHATQHGYVSTILGRRRAIPEITSTNGNTRALGERLAINTVVQGSAADLIKLAMVNLHRRIEAESLPMKMLLQIHDELVFETPAKEADRCSEIIQHEMQTAMPLKVPLVVELGRGSNWFEAK
ncbi:MAG: DNA polymerase I [Phycisphaeraceae bacterium]|nr:DNA polymerase I [Phycisphaeraceae bacterium]